MSNGIRGLTSQMMRNAAKSIENRVKRVKWMNYEFSVRYSIGFSEYVKLIQKVVADCQNDNGEIAIELIDFSLRSNIIATYANIELPDNLDEVFRIVYASGLYELVENAVNLSQIKSIETTVKMIVG
jgi:hypothetical protein